MAHDTTNGTPRASRRLTIEDVASSAGVSAATVSRALRNLPNVSPSTREQVHAAADQLGYRPDPAAARLATGRTRTITVAVPSLSSWYFSNVVAGAETVCTGAGFEFQVIAVGSPARRDRLLDESHRLERRTDALILVDVMIEPEQVASLERRRIGLATIGSNLIGHPSVCIDDELVGRTAARHLMELGHRRVAVIGGDPDSLMSFDVPTARWRGFSRTVSDAGLTITDDDHVDATFDVEGGRVAMTMLLARPAPPTAVFAMSDEMAFGALIACHDAGRRPGSDMSIIGVDDHEFSKVVDLTTIRQSVADHGSVVARMLIAEMTKVVGARDDTRIDRRSLSGPFRPTFSLVERSSTGPPTG